MDNTGQVELNINSPAMTSVRWLVGILFFVVGVMGFKSSVFGALLALVSALIFFPTTAKQFENVAGIAVTGKFLVAAIFMGSFGAMEVSSQSKKINEDRAELIRKENDSANFESVNAYVNKIKSLGDNESPSGMRYYNIEVGEGGSYVTYTIQTIDQRKGFMENLSEGEMYGLVLKRQYCSKSNADLMWFRERNVTVRYDLLANDGKFFSSTSAGPDDCIGLKAKNDTD